MIYMFGRLIEKIMPFCGGKRENMIRWKSYRRAGGSFQKTEDFFDTTADMFLGLLNRRVISQDTYDAYGRMLFEKNGASFDGCALLQVPDGWDDLTEEEIKNVMSAEKSGAVHEIVKVVEDIRAVASGADIDLYFGGECFPLYHNWCVGMTCWENLDCLFDDIRDCIGRDIESDESNKVVECVADWLQENSCKE